MKRVAMSLLFLILLASCAGSAPSDEEKAELFLDALAAEEWTQDVPFGLPPFVVTSTAEADSPGVVGTVSLSSIIETKRMSGGVVNITYVIFGSYEEASAAANEYVRAMAENGKRRSNVGQSRLCVVDAAAYDECTAVAGNAMVRVLSRLKVSGLADAQHTEEMMDLALAHLRAVKDEAGL